MCDTGLNIVAAMAVNIFARCHASPFQCVNYACVTVTVHQLRPWVRTLARPVQRLHAFKIRYKIRNMFYYLEWAGHVAALMFSRLWRGMCAFVLTT